MSAPILKLLDTVDWKPTESPEQIQEGELYATHTGVLNIGGVELQCATLNNGTRIFYGKVFDELLNGLKEMEAQ